MKAGRPEAGYMKGAPAAYTESSFNRALGPPLGNRREADEFFFFIFVVGILLRVDGEYATLSRLINLRT